MTQLKQARKRQRHIKTRQDRATVVDDLTSLLQSYYSVAYFKKEFEEAYGTTPSSMTWSSVVKSVMNKGQKPDGGNLLAGLGTTSRTLRVRVRIAMQVTCRVREIPRETFRFFSISNWMLQCVNKDS